MHRSTNVYGSLCLALALTACGGGWSGFIIPQESPLKPWVVQSEDEILEQAGMAADEAGEDGEDFVDYEDEEDDADDDKVEAPAPTGAPGPAAKPAPKTAK